MIKENNITDQNRKTGNSMVWFPLINISKKRELIFHLAISNIKIRFKDTYLGFLWTGLEPLFTFLILYLVFTSIRSTGENFAIYLISGVMLYHIFTRGTMGGLGSLRGNVGIIKSLNVKREIFPVAATIAMAILSVIEVGVLIGLMPFFQFTPGLTILLIPIPIILMLILVLGMSYLLSIINVFVKDIQTFWGIAVTALFFISPIFWYIKDTDGLLLTIHSINPVGQLIEIFHKIVVFNEIPSISDWLYASMLVFAIFIFGYTIFRKYENKILEEL